MNVFIDQVLHDFLLISIAFTESKKVSKDEEYYQKTVRSPTFFGLQCALRRCHSPALYMHVWPYKLLPDPWACIAECHVRFKNSVLVHAL